MNGTSDWQRRYDQSLAEERARANDDGVTVGEVAATEVSSWLPGWLGAVAFAATAVVVLVRRRLRRPSARAHGDESGTQ